MPNNRVMVEWQGGVRSLMSLAEEHGISKITVRSRLREGLSLEEALTKPVRPTGPRKKRVDGKIVTTCGVEDCSRLESTKGLCDMHYGRWLKHGDPYYVPATHGMCYTAEYGIWASMRDRCNNPNHPRYEGWGGRGIFVCDAWNNSFEAFFADMGERPTPKHSIDRIDNDGPYSPENCRWATWSEQQKNRSTTRRVQWQGRTRYLVELCEEYGLVRETVYARIRMGWSLEDALTRPAHKKAPSRHSA